MNSVRRNLVYNILYQILVLILPFITVPYISRVLGAEGVGVYSYTYSIVYFFMIFTLLGINNHGNRIVAKVRDDKTALSKTFLSIYAIQLASGLLMILLYVIYMFTFNNSYIVVAWLQIIYIFSAIFDINWFFFGLEEFRITVTRNTAVKLVSLVLIFILVRGSDDVYIYTIIMSLSTLVSQLLLIPFLLKRIHLQKISIYDIKEHIKPVIIMFIPSILSSIYTVMDKTMLGYFSSTIEVGIYEQADKIVRIPMGIITALGTVMLPRASNLVAKNKHKEVIKYIDKSVGFMMFLAFPICFGLIAIADNFVPLFLGNDFMKSALLVKCMSVIVVFMSFANILRTQYLMPYEKDKDFVVSLLLGAIMNLVLNYLLIPTYQSFGTCVGTITAEFIVMIYQCVVLKNHLPFLKYLKTCLKYFVFSLIMFVLIIQFNYTALSAYVIITLQIVSGGLIYCMLNIKYIRSLIKDSKIFKRIKERIKD